MTALLNEILAANAAYAAGFGPRGRLAMPPARRLAILTCMDARLDPAKFRRRTGAIAAPDQGAGAR